jgi:hypothetical protein
MLNIRVAMKQQLLNVRIAVKEQLPNDENSNCEIYHYFDTDNLVRGQLLCIRQSICRDSPRPTNEKQLILDMTTLCPM